VHMDFCLKQLEDWKNQHHHQSRLKVKPFAATAN